jgi:neutral ceramidase
MNLKMRQKMKHKFLRWFIKVIVILLLLIIILIVSCLRTVSNEPYSETKYYKNTLETLDNIIASLPESSSQNLLVGAGKAGFTPPIGTPLAGYGNRKGAPSTGVNDSLFVRVIALQTGDRVVCLIGYDALHCPPRIARIIEDSLKNQFELSPDQLLFTATHTHAGPGGWGKGWVEKQFAGSPDPKIPLMYVDSTMMAVQRALDTIRSSEFKYGIIRAPHFVRNRLVGEKGKKDDELVYVNFSKDKQNIAMFVTFSAHATVLSGRNMLFSGDYPGYLERRLEDKLGGIVLFAVAGVGSHSPTGPGKGFEKAQNIGYALADSVLTNLKNQQKESCDLLYFRLPVEQNELQIRITDNLRLAPWLARKFFDVNDSYIQVVKLNNMLIFGSPAEYSGELAMIVKKSARAKGFETTVTSFNGCYLGYVTPSKYDSLGGYETRLMSFLGPYTGDYLTEMMIKIVGKL